jgi:hypothetical protein
MGEQPEKKFKGKWGNSLRKNYLKNRYTLVDLTSVGGGVNVRLVDGGRSGDDSGMEMMMELVVGSEGCNDEDKYYWVAIVI